MIKHYIYNVNNAYNYFFYLEAFIVAFDI